METNLYKLNKDELVYLISTIKENTIEELSKDKKRLRYLLALQELKEYKKEIINDTKYNDSDKEIFIELFEKAKKILHSLTYNYDFISLCFEYYDDSKLLIMDQVSIAIGEYRATYQDVENSKDKIKVCFRKYHNIYQSVSIDEIINGTVSLN